MDKDQIMEAIENMTVLELADLVKAMEDKFGVSAAAPGTVPAAPSGQYPGLAPGMGRQPPGSRRHRTAGSGTDEPGPALARLLGPAAPFGSGDFGRRHTSLAAPEEGHRSVSVRSYAIMKKNTTEEF